MTTTIRQATIEDSTAIARVQVDSWRTAYCGIIRQDVLDGLDETQWENGWRSQGMARFHGENALFVAERNGLVAGFAGAGRGRDEDFQNIAELYCIYIATAEMGTGVGTILFNTCAGHSRHMGFSAMYNWCLKENGNARTFYQRMGASLIEGIERDFKMEGDDHCAVFFRKDIIRKDIK